jgi:hypothetical protein
MNINELVLPQVPEKLDILHWAVQRGTILNV